MSRSKEQIPALVASNLDGLRRLCYILESRKDPSQSLAQSCLTRFKLWAGSLGAHRTSGTRSLEYRLRDASSIRKHLISLLRELKDIVIGEALPFLQSSYEVEEKPQLPGDSVDDELAALFDAGSDDGFETSTDSSSKEIADLLFGTGNIIDCLLRFSVTISNPAPHDHFKSRAGLELTRHFEPYDFKHVCDKFPRMNVKLAQRLGRMLTYRRRYFVYRKEHHNRLKQGIEEDFDDNTSLEPGTTVASSLPQGLKDGIQTHLTVVKDNRSEISATSYASSAPGGSDLRVPPIPKGYADGPFLCPFCFVLVSVDSRHEWKKHIFRDLRPYACLEETCVLDHDFQRRKDWTWHMLQAHWRAWTCPFGCIGEYSSSPALRNHLDRNHAIDVADHDMDAAVNLSSKANVSRGEGVCPLCHDFDIKSIHQYRSHVGQHLEQLALFVLPPPDEEEGEGEEADDDDDDRFGDEASRPSEDNDLGMEEIRGQYEPAREQKNEQVDQAVVSDDVLESGRTSPKLQGIRGETYRRAFKRAWMDLTAERRKAEEDSKQRKDGADSVELPISSQVQKPEKTRFTAEYETYNLKLSEEIQDLRAEAYRKSEAAEDRFYQFDQLKKNHAAMMEWWQTKRADKEEKHEKEEAKLTGKKSEEEDEHSKLSGDAMVKVEKEVRGEISADKMAEEVIEEAAMLKYENEFRVILEKERLDAEEARRRLEDAEKMRKEFHEMFNKMIEEEITKMAEGPKTAVDDDRYA